MSLKKQVENTENLTVERYEDGETFKTDFKKGLIPHISYKLELDDFSEEDYQVMLETLKNNYEEVDEKPLDYEELHSMFDKIDSDWYDGLRDQLVQEIGPSYMMRKGNEVLWEAEQMNKGAEVNHSEYSELMDDWNILDIDIDEPENYSEFLESYNQVKNQIRSIEGEEQ